MSEDQMDLDHLGRSYYFALDENHEPYPVTRKAAYALRAKGPTSVGRDEVNGAVVSTVFLATPFWPGKTPYFFETMVFGGQHDSWAERHHTWADAADRHAQVVDALRNGREP